VKDLSTKRHKYIVLFPLIAIGSVLCTLKCATWSVKCDAQSHMLNDDYE